MKHLYKKSLFIFRRDLRLQDNTALNNALKESETVIPCFIFDPQQITKRNEFYSPNAVQFMIASLTKLNKELDQHKSKLFLFYGNSTEVIKTIIANEKIDALFVNRDYTPFSIQRDKHLEHICQDNDIPFKSYSDVMLVSPELVQKKDGSTYSMFTAFYNNARTITIREPHTEKGSFFSGNLKNTITEKEYAQLLPTVNKKILLHGGTKEGETLLKNLALLARYNHTHDYPSYDTSHLSAHLKFGTISVRKAYHAIVDHLGKAHPLIRQLYWRDFFCYIGLYHPTVFGNPFKQKYAQIPWSTDKKIFSTWCKGETGFPLVDAGMRQLNTTGFMHNRVRMVVASFLIKDLHINWLWGEKYFAQQLIDYDPAVNNGNWQWVASTGCDAQPYFRIFNPWLQQKKYDPECTYIKQWVPELKTQEPKTIHNWFKNNSPYIKNYPRPIVDHAQQSAITKIVYKKAKNL